MMSGTNYTRTPNLQLYKPTYKADGEMWGDHINWNADTLDTLLGTGTGGTFLPIAGGQMSGPLNVTTTGASRSWSVQDRFAEVVDIQDYGQIGTGNAATDTATFLAAVAALPANGGLLWIGGTNTQGITLNQTITITKSCKILGATANGWCSSIVCLMSGPAILFSDPTPSYQKTFEVENVRFVANNGTGPTRSAIQVNVGPATSQVFPTFIGRNITISSNVASAASPYAQTFTRGVEFVPASVSGTGGVHNFWNVVLENVFFLGVTDSGTGQPIAGTAGVAFGHLICAMFRFVHVSLAAAGLHQTDYCEGITCIACQLFTCGTGWDQASFAPTGSVRLLQPVFIGGIINGGAAIVLDCVSIGQFSNNYFQASGATAIALSDSQGSQICNNSINGSTTGVALTHGANSETGNIVASNYMTNQTTNVSLGAGTYDYVLDNHTNTGAIVIADSSGGNSTIRNDYLASPRTIGAASSADTELHLVGATNGWRALAIFGGSAAAAGQRWAIGALGGTEGGSNSGSDFAINAYSDTGGNLGQPLIITRATGAIQMWNGLGLFGHAPVTARPTVTGAKGGNAALASLLAALASYGLLTDSST